MAPRATEVWKAEHDNAMIGTLLMEKAAGRQAQLGWKPQAWAAVVSALTELNVVKDAKQCKNRFQRVSGYLCIN